MFTETRKLPDVRRGRPPGRTAQGHAARDRLYAAALELLRVRGYAATTMRDIGKAAGVSPALLYRYFPSKHAVLLALYEDLSARFSEQTESLPAGPWRERFLFATEASLAVLKPQRATIAGLIPVLVSDVQDGVFAESSAPSRRRVQAVFEQAVTGAKDAPPEADARALGRILYLVHLTILLWWALDRSREQRTTAGLLALAGRLLPPVALALKFGHMRRLLRSGDALFRVGLLGEPLRPGEELP